MPPGSAVPAGAVDAAGEGTAGGALDRRLAMICADAFETEMRRLGRELHDDLGQTLVVLKLELDALALGTVDPGFAASARRLAGVAGTALASLNRVSSQLRPPLLEELGFARAVSALVQGFSTRIAAGCSVRLIPEALEVPQPLSSIFFRVAQAALEAAERAGGVCQVDLDIEKSAQAVALRVRIERAPRRRLAAAGSPAVLTDIIPDSLRERVHSLSGALRVEVDAGRVTVVEVQFPLD